MSQTELDVTILVPVFNEADNVGDLIDEITAAMAGRSYEIIVVDDCSTDDTRERVVAKKATTPHLRLISHNVNAGQSRALRTGVSQARGRDIATLDGDGQNDPADVPRLLDHLNNGPDDLALVGGKRTKRKDTAWKRFGSKVGNGVRKKLLKDKADDTACGLKVYRRDAYLQLPYFDHMHRFMPALMLREGYDVDFLAVNHRERWHGQSKYTNFGRLAVSLRDLRGVMWLNARARNPQGYREF